MHRTRLDGFGTIVEGADKKEAPKQGITARQKGRVYSQRSPREKYVLTALGRDFLPVLRMIRAWAR